MTLKGERRVCTEKAYLGGHSKITSLKCGVWGLEWGGGRCMSKRDGVLQGFGVFPEPLHNDLSRDILKDLLDVFWVSFS